jgi:hypothetical protein
MAATVSGASPEMTFSETPSCRKYGLAGFGPQAFAEDHDAERMEIVGRGQVRIGCDVEALE